jgi:two-component sensor histidine kinase
VSLYRRLELDSIWSRLLGTMAVVVVPAAALIILLAYSLYTSGLAELEVSQATAVRGRAASVRSWLDAAGRSLANEAFAARYVGSEQCHNLAETFLKRNPGFASVRFVDQTSASCAAGLPIDANSLTAPAQNGQAADYRLDLVNGQIWIVAVDPGGSGPDRIECVLIVDGAALRDRLLTVEAQGETQAALSGPHNEIVTVYPDPSPKTWAPDKFPGRSTVWRAADLAGQAATFAYSPIEGSALGVLMRFDDRRLTAAQHRLAILCLTQLAMLGLLAVVYAAAIRRDVVQWIQAIEAAARARDRDPEGGARAPVTPGMPGELRSVAESFNAMTDHALERAHALRASLSENRALMLEMHHRIKNSLQVIQSYLALIRRSAARPEAALLARIEARVGVLAVAYRLALTPNGIRPMAAKPFLEEICAAAIGGLRKPRQRVAYAIEWAGELPVDRAIPLGLGLVEALIAAFGAYDVSYVGVRLAAGEDGAVELRVESDALPAEADLPQKVMRGLANQLGAEAIPARGGEILGWRFHP